MIEGIDQRIAFTMEQNKTDSTDADAILPEDMPVEIRLEKGKSNIQIIRELFRGLEDQYVRKSDQVEKEYNGVIGFFVNNINSSDSIVYGIINGINQMVFRDAIGSALVIFLGVILTVLIWMFLKNLLVLGGCRFFMENHRYYSTDLRRIFFPFRVKHVGNQIVFLYDGAVYPGGKSGRGQKTGISSVQENDEREQVARFRAGDEFSAVVYRECPDSGPGGYFLAESIFHCGFCGVVFRFEEKGH